MNAPYMYVSRIVRIWNFFRNIGILIYVLFYLLYVACAKHLKQKYVENYDFNYRAFFPGDPV